MIYPIITSELCIRDSVAKGLELESRKRQDFSLLNINTVSGAHLASYPKVIMSKVAGTRN
jgi:hypothetical protein